MSLREIRNAVELFSSRVERRESAPLHLAKACGEWKATSWGAAREHVVDLATSLLESGFERGQVAGIVSLNRPEWHLAELGILAAGGVTTAVYPTSPAKDAAWVLGDSEARVAFVENREQAEKVLSVRSELPSLREIVVFGEDRVEGTTPFDAFLERGRARRAARAEELARVRRELTRDDLLTIIYTSGTTGPPKGAMLTHGNVLAVCEALLQIVDPGDDDLILSFLPLAHALERVGGLYVPIAAGATIAFAESFERISDNLEEVGPTFVSAVPRFFEKAHAKVLATLAAKPAPLRRIGEWALAVGAEHAAWARRGGHVRFSLRLRHALADRLVLAKIRRRFGGRIRYFVSGGAPLPADVGRFFESCGLLILEGYGATETTAPATLTRPDDVVFGAVGRPLPGVDVRLAEDGEILVKGENIFAGYWRDADTTATVLEDGWYKTGDIGRFDDDGRLYITDRKKDLIVTSGGKNVAPQNLERHFKEHPDVAELVVHGDRRHFLSAIVVPDRERLAKTAVTLGLDGAEEATLLRHPAVFAHFDRIVEERNSELAPYERIRKFFLAIDEFQPGSELLTPTLKIRRRKVEECFRAELDAFYAEA